MGRAACAPSSTCVCRASSTGSGAACCRPIMSSRSCAPRDAEDSVPIWWWCSARRSTSASGSAASATPGSRTSSMPTSRARRHVDVPTPSPATSPRCCGSLADHVGPRVDHDDVDRRTARRRDGRSHRRRRCCWPPPTTPIKPSAGSTASCGKRLARDAVVICDGGDFASYAGKFVEVVRAWLLARHRSVRLPGQRARVRHRCSGRPADQPDRAAARRRRRRLQPDGRRLAWFATTCRW